MQDTTIRTLTFTTAPCWNPLTKKVDKWRGFFNNSRTRSIDETATDMVAMGCQSSKEMTTYVLTFYANHLIDLMLLDGCRRSFGPIGTMVPTITGSFDTPDAKFDSAKNGIEIRCRVNPLVRHGMDGIHLINVTSPDYNPQLWGVMDTTTNEHEMLKVGDLFQAIGQDMYIDGSRTDEGVYFTGGTLTAEIKLNVTSSNDMTTTFEFPESVTQATLPAGKYTLQVRTRDGRAATEKLYTLSREVGIKY